MAAVKALFERQDQDPAFAESDSQVKPSARAFPAQFSTFTLLYKVAMVATKFELTHRQVKWLFAHGPKAGWLDLNTLPIDAAKPAAPFDQWLRLAELARLRDRLPQGENALEELFAHVASVSAASPVAEKNAAKQAWVAALVHWTQWSESDLETLLGKPGDHANTGQLVAVFPADYVGERLLARLRECFSLLKRLGMPAELGRTLAAREVFDPLNADPAVAPDTARKVQQAVRAKYDEAQWLTLAKPLRDVLREKQRAALVTYLISYAKPSQNVRDANDLYAHFLIDVEMDPCMMTSRIKQAISSTQLFVQRCLMNLEPEVTAGTEVDEHWRQWKWMKNYRVWEANRKVFLYPENWIEPELRDDKSPFFKALESELLQSDLTLETAETAFLHYLEKLDQVARLEIVGMYHQLEEDLSGNTAVDILHVFGRTYGTPRNYYYRQRVNKSYWTAWDRVDLDIEGDHLIPVVWNRRLYLFWPIFTEKAKPLAPALKAGNLSGSDPVKYWEIKLAWSERKRGKWTNKSVSSEFIDYGQLLAVVPPPPGKAFKATMEKLETFFFRSFVDEHNDLYILALNRELQPTNYFIGASAFRFDGCHADPKRTFLSPSAVVSLTGTHVFHMLLRETGEGSLFLPAPTDSEALRQTPGTFLLLPHADGASFTEHPFFFLDNTRTFFVIATPVHRPIRDWVNVVALDPGIVHDLGNTYYAELKPLPLNRLGPISNPRDPMLFEPSFPARPDFAAVREGTLRSGVARFSRITEPADALASPALALASPAAAPDTMARIALTGVRNRVFSNLLRENLITSTVVKFRPRNGYLFQTHYHPYVCAFVRELNRDGVDGLLQRKIQTEPWLFLPRAPGAPAPEPLNFANTYQPTSLIGNPYPKEDVDFEYGGAYSQYNWELFFHAPLLIADRLSKNQRFEEAQKWFHYIFDPTDTSSDPIPQRYWRTRKFYETTSEDYQKQRIQEILKLLAAGGDPARRAALSPKELDELERLENSVDEWRKNPFKPHLIARMRTAAYQKTVVMKYIDNLIAWGDQLFRRDTIESINEATQLYILAAEILGRRPVEIPPRATPRFETYDSLEPRLDKFSNTLVQIEEFVAPSAASEIMAPVDEPPLTLPAMLYFCIPKNDKLLGYWDIVADRLFKIRHCMNIEGVVRQLPLFEPPIDPGLLVRAVAAGIDLSSVLNDINAVQPHYRFNVVAQKASEICAELKSLGSALLSALEKRDAEELALLRAKHETTMLELIEQVKQHQYEEAVENQKALRASRHVAIGRYLHYQKLLGMQSPQSPGEGQPIPEQSPSSQASIMDVAGAKMIPYEAAELVSLTASHAFQSLASGADVAASVAHVIPNFNVEPWGVGATFGGSNIGSAISAFAGFYRAISSQFGFAATLASKLGQYVMRAHDWTLQNNLAAREIMQIDKQIAAAEIRKQIAEKEIENHRKQIDNAKEVEAFMRDKYTNQELYSWMVGQISGVYFQTYQLAYDVAKRAERAYRFELGLKDSSFVQFGYWDSLKKGLLAGEKLYHDLKRMEVDYLDQNRREYEITKHVSLVQLDPLALIQLKQTGECFVSLPETLFDLDYPGHYMRRIKSVSVTIPCITGPYTSVNCTLTLLKSSIRHASTLPSGYARDLENEDLRFSDNIGSIQSIVTSNAQNDSGLFETSLRDERYLPFEGAGTISEWRLELPRDFRSFEYDTISDVVQHIRYTAREGGGPLKQQATLELQTGVNEFVRRAGEHGIVKSFSLRHEFPSEWHRFLTTTDTNGNHVQAFTLSKDRFPFLFQGRTLTIKRVDLFGVPKAEKQVSELPGLTPPGQAVRTPEPGAPLGQLLHHVVTQLSIEVASVPDEAAWTFTVPKASAQTFVESTDDILVLCTYQVT